MDMQTSRTVTLPDGTRVEDPTIQQPWWTGQDGYGFVGPSLIAPDPTQPRTYIDPDRLVELQLSIAAGGVRQNLTVTPRHLAPWIHLSPAYENTFFIVVSGHRRRDAAITVDLPAVPVTVKIYQNEQEHMLDRSILNKAREDLSELEEGMEYLALRESGLKIVEIATKFGLHPPQVINRIHLTKLHEDIKLLIRPELAKKRRLAVATAETLGSLKAPSPAELQRFQDLFEDILVDSNDCCSDVTKLDEDERRFLFQKMFVAVIFQRGMNAARSIEFIREHSGRSSTHGTYDGRSIERYEPRRRQDLINTMLKQILESVLGDWKREEFERIFRNTPREEIEKIITKMRSAESLIKDFRLIMESIRDKKPITSPEVMRYMGK